MAVSETREMSQHASGAAKRPSISVIIPALDEAATIKAAIAMIPISRLQDAGFSVEVIVVDNNSVDMTAAYAREGHATVVFERTRGYGRALRTGISRATGDVIIFGDADCTYPLDQMEVFIRPILDGSADFVTGSRMLGRILPGAMPLLHRYVGVPVLTFVLNILFGLTLTDGHCGMRAVTRAGLRELQLECDGMEFATELLVRVKQAGLRIVEIPIEYRPRPASSVSKLRSFRDGWRHIRFMLREFARTLILPRDALSDGKSSALPKTASAVSSEE